MLPSQVFLPPPPGNRLFWSFVMPPRLEIVAKPEVRAQRGATPGRQQQVEAADPPRIGWHGPADLENCRPPEHPWLALLSPAMQVNSRLIRRGYAIARVSAWVEGRLRAAIAKNSVFPGCGERD